jgi:hypothetical protein
MNQSGKSSLCIEMGGKFQELYPDEHVLFVDLEDTFTQNTLALLESM